MSRCQHCNKLTHSENLIVEYSAEEHEKVMELSRLSDWIAKYHYIDEKTPKEEYGKLKCGDIWIHFRVKSSC